MTRVLATAIALVLFTSSVAHADERHDRAAKLLHRGIKLMEAELHGEAAKIFREAATLVPEKPSPYFYLGKALALQELCAEATPQLEEYLERTTRGELSSEARTLIEQCQRKVTTESANASAAAQQTPRHPPDGRILELHLGRDDGHTDESPQGGRVGLLYVVRSGRWHFGGGAALVFRTNQTYGRTYIGEGAARYALVNRRLIQLHAGASLHAGFTSFEPAPDDLMMEPQLGIVTLVAPEARLAIPIRGRFGFFLLLRISLGGAYNIKEGAMHGARTSTLLTGFSYDL